MAENQLSEMCPARRGPAQNRATIPGKSEQINWGTVPGFLLSRQKTGQDRDLINNPRIYQDAGEGAEGMLACAGTSGRRNAIYGTAELNRGMMRGAVMDASVGGCAAASVRTGAGGPSDRRCAGATGPPTRTPCRSHSRRRCRASWGSCAMRAGSPRGG